MGSSSTGFSGSVYTSPMSVLSTPTTAAMSPASTSEHLGTAQIVEGEELLDRGRLALAIVLDHEDLVARVDGTGVDAADADATHEVGVVDGHALHGERAVDVDLGRGQVVDDHVEQRVHVHVAVLGVEAGVAVDARAVHHVLHGKLELLIGGAQIGHEVETVVVCLLGVGAGAVDLVDDDHDVQTGVYGMTQDEARLGHGALEGVDQQERTVRHAQHALDLASKVGMAGGVDDVDLYAVVVDGDVLGKNRDTALALLVVESSTRSCTSWLARKAAARRSLSHKVVLP